MTHKSPMPDNPMLQRNKCQLPFSKAGPIKYDQPGREFIHQDDTSVLRVLLHPPVEEHLFKLAMCIHFQLIAKVF